MVRIVVNKVTRQQGIEALNHNRYTLKQEWRFSRINRNITRNSVVADKPRDAFAKIVKCCQQEFCFNLPSVTLARRTEFF